MKKTLVALLVAALLLIPMALMASADDEPCPNFIECPTCGLCLCEEDDCECGHCEGHDFCTCDLCDECGGCLVDDCGCEDCPGACTCDDGNGNNGDNGDCGKCKPKITFEGVVECIVSGLGKFGAFLIGGFFSLFLFWMYW